MWHKVRTLEETKNVGSGILNFYPTRSQGSNVANFGLILPFPDPNLSFNSSKVMKYHGKLLAVWIIQVVGQN